MKVIVLFNGQSISFIVIGSNVNRGVAVEIEHKFADVLNG